MSSIENDSTADESKNDLNALSKKEIRKKLLEQLEFYFSDSNLTKDRFLKQEINNSIDGFLSLTIFLHFNKIRTLGVNLKDFKKVIKKSEILELNDDETMVRRKTPFVELTQKEIDKKTIYVENIPSKITYEEIKDIFDQYGKISYISLPKFKTTNQLKGFAFIEFDKKEDSKKAKEAFRSQNEQSDDEPMGKFPKANAQIIELEKRIKKVNEEIDFIENKNETINTESQKNKKRKNEVDHQEGSNKKLTDNQTTKRKNTNKKEEWFKNLKVVSKKKWLKLKDQFLENQKKEVDSLKEKLNELNLKLSTLKSDQVKPKQVSSDVKIDRGCIIKIQLNLNDEKDYEMFNMGRKRFQEKFLNSFDEHIAYIDMEKNSNRILVRCKSSESAKFLLENKIFLDGYTKVMLKDDEEDKYFEKISLNRNKKQEKKERKEKQKPFKLVEQTSKISQKDEFKDDSKPKHVQFD